MAVYNNSNVSTVENFLEGVKGVDIVPGYASFDEMAFFVIEAAESDYNDMMMQVGIQELACLESSGTEVVYEAGSGRVKELCDKAADMFKSMWEKLKGMFNKALDTINQKTMEFRRKVMDKLDSKMLQSRVKGLKADKKFGSSFDYIGDGSPKDLSAYAKNTIGKITGADEKVQKLYTSASEKAKDENTTELNNLSDELNKVVKEVISDVAPGAQQISSIVKTMKDDIRGKRRDVNGSWVSSNFNSLYKEAKDFPETKRQIKGAYKEAETAFNKSIKACKDASSARFFEANAFTKAIKAYKDLKHICVACSQATVSCLNERQAFYRTVILRVAGSKAVKESAVSEGAASTSDNISSLFNW